MIGERGATPDPHHLFVYGTLMEGYWRHRYLTEGSGVRFLGPGWVRARLYDLGSYPGAVPDPSPHERVRGEIYECSRMEALLEKLDPIEGYDPEDRSASLFRREAVEVESDRGGAVMAWIYWWNRSLDGRSRIAAGDYRECQRT